MPRLRVLHPGSLTTVQDRGRPGWAHLGVAPSGALDRPAYELANRLVGNADGLAALEATFGGLTLVADAWMLFAVTGATCPVLVDSRPAPLHAPFSVGPGQALRLGAPSAGVRNYVAVRGGLELPTLYGSAATDVLSGLGPPPLRAGDSLQLGPAVGEAAWVDHAPVAAPSDELTLRITVGPRADWFRGGGLEQLRSATYVVSPDSNRIGVRLTGPKLCRRHDRELASEGIVTGAIEVPPDGQPLIFLHDHPTTGGYPVIAVVRPQDLAAVAQARPGARIRFTS